MKSTLAVLGVITALTVIATSFLVLSHEEQEISSSLSHTVVIRQFPAGCGNGTLEEGEECDDGNNEPGDECSPDCLLEFCGDGIVTESLDEECDPGGLTETYRCKGDCTLQSAFNEAFPWPRSVVLLATLGCVVVFIARACYEVHTMQNDALDDWIVNHVPLAERKRLRNAKHISAVANVFVDAIHHDHLEARKKAESEAKATGTPPPSLETSDKPADKPAVPAEPEAPRKSSKSSKRSKSSKSSKRSRSSSKGKKAPAVAAAPATLSSSGMTEEEAAKRIQATFRKKFGRGNAGATPAAPAIPSGSKKTAMTEDQAATKIQSAFRTKLKSKKKKEEDDEVPEQRSFVRRTSQTMLEARGL